jgi:hypothetical protein
MSGHALAATPARLVPPNALIARQAARSKATRATRSVRLSGIGPPRTTAKHCLRLPAASVLWVTVTTWHPSPRRSNRCQTGRPRPPPLRHDGDNGASGPAWPGGQPLPAGGAQLPPPVVGATVTGQAGLVGPAAQLLAVLLGQSGAEGWVLHAAPSVRSDCAVTDGRGKAPGDTSGQDPRLPRCGPYLRSEPDPTASITGRQPVCAGGCPPGDPGPTRGRGQPPPSGCGHPAWPGCWSRAR